MDYKVILYIIQLLVFLSYVSFIWIKYGVQKSISESYYALPKKINFLFTFFCWGFSIPLIIIGDNALMFLAGSGIVFVGAAAQIKEKMTRQVHMVSAYAGIILSQVAIGVVYKMYYVNISFIISALIFFLLRKYMIDFVWWIEIVAFISIVYVLGLIVFK